jgi:hypothetical protein
MSEAENGALFVFDVMGGCHRNVGVAQHFACGGQPIAGVDLRAEFLSQGVRGVLETTPFERSQSINFRMSLWQRCWP